MKSPSYLSGRDVKICVMASVTSDEQADYEVAIGGEGGQTGGREGGLTRAVLWVCKARRNNIRDDFNRKLKNDNNADPTRLFLYHTTTSRLLHYFRLT